jgi:hypothetical protein
MGWCTKTIQIKVCNNRVCNNRVCNNRVCNNRVCNNRVCNNRVCNKEIQVRRVFLPCAGISSIIIFQEIQTYIYLPIIIGFFFFIIFWNFPKIIYISNTKPLYYEDLFVDTDKLPLLDISPYVKTKFENTFERTLIITNTLLISALSDYWLYRTHTTTSYMTILGVTGGILKIFQIINYSSGAIILFVTRKLIKREILKQGKNTIYSNSKETELMNLDVRAKPTTKINMAFSASNVTIDTDIIPIIDNLYLNKRKKLKPR